MDIEEFVKKNMRQQKDENEIIEKLTTIIEYYKNINSKQAKLLSKTVYDEVKTTENLDKTELKKLLDYPKTNIHMGEFGVGSRGQGDFYVHNQIAQIIKNTDTSSIVNPTAQDDGGVVKVEDTYYITTAIDGIHSRLSDYPFLAGFHTARATLRDVCVMGANPVALISDIHLADDGDVGKILDYTAGICAVSELTQVPLVSGSTLRIGGDMVLGDRLVGAVGAVGSSNTLPKARSNAKEGDLILMTEGCGGGTITTTSIYNNYPEVIKETLNVQFIKASQLLNNYPSEDKIHAMTDITNGGIIGDSNEINKTTGLGIHLYSENIKNLINSKVYNMLDDLDIDVLGVSVDSLMIIVSEEESDTIIRLLNENKIKTDVIGKITNTGKTYLEDESGNIKQLVPKFREAAYTPIKKVIDSINEVDFEENKKTINHATVESIKKKDEIVSWIKSRYEWKRTILLYDGVLAIIILFIIMIVCFNILEKESTVYELDNTYKTPYEVLNLLDTMPYNDESILYSLTMIDDINTELESNLLNITEHIISDNTRYEYILRDITTDKLLLKTSDNKKIIYSGRKIVNGHVFELDFLI